MNSWVLTYDGFDPAQEGLREALCTLGNGYLGTRGAACEATADGVHYPGTYIAGCFNRLSSEVAGRMVENEDLVNVPNWLHLTFRIDDGPWFALDEIELESYRQELDLKAGVLSRDLRFRDAEGRVTRFESRRFVHIDAPHLAGQEIRLTPENWSGKVEILSGLDGRVTNAGVARYRALNGQHLEPMESRLVSDDTVMLKVRTVQSRTVIAQAARTDIRCSGVPVESHRDLVVEPGLVAQRTRVAVEQGRTLDLRKTVAIYTSKDQAISECGEAACEAIRQAPDFDALLANHVAAWAHLWEQFDIDVEPVSENADGRVLLILRLHLFHLLQTASPNIMDLDVSVGARGLHGEAYRGHIFWDEIFIFPLLNLRLPEVTRGLLKYRFRRLPEARTNAQNAGFEGAMFPWQSGSNGREETQELHLNPKSGHWLPDNSRLQRHVNGAVAYNVWRYFQDSDDCEFLAYFGAEVLLEIARFWASLATHDPADDRYDIRGVVGPDEYHDAYPNAERPGVDNNAYTNVIAAWSLWRALEALETVSPDQRYRLTARLGLDDDEIARWDHVSRRMRLVFHDGGVLSQFEGYDALKEFDWEGYRHRYGDIQRLDRILESEDDTANNYRASKQADVLMLFYLFSSDELAEVFERLGYEFDDYTVQRNIDHYMHRTSHGSTLSRLVHSWVLARTDRPRSWELLRGALESDIADIQGGTTQEGIHLGAMAGTVDLVQRCYSGLETRRGVLWFNPCLPDELRCLRYSLRHRGNFLLVRITHERLELRAERCGAAMMRVGVGRHIYDLAQGQVMRFDLTSEGFPHMASALEAWSAE